MGCNGSATLTVDGGSVDRPMAMANEAGTKQDAASGVDLGNIMPTTLPPAPPPNTDSVKVVSGKARLVGTHLDACSNQTPATGDRWCAFTLPDPVIGQTDLWVMNMTKASAGTKVTCDVTGKVTDPNCMRVTSNLWTGTPNGGPRHPTTHRFDGDTLIFHADAAADLMEYSGPIYAWRPGWAAARQISGGKAAYTCVAHGAAQVYFCFENLTPPTDALFQFDLTAGRLTDTTPAQMVARMTPERAGTMSTQWKVAYTRQGDYLAWSTGGATVAEVETFHAIKYDDLGHADKIITAPAGIARWVISGDSKKMYYMRNYNYPAAGNDPSGTLMMADFPSGMNEVMVATNVGALHSLEDASGGEGIGFFDNVKNGTATYKIVRNRDMPTMVTTVVPTTAGIAALTSDLKFLYYYKQVDDTNGTTDGYIAKTDGTGVPCTLATTATTDQYGAPFTPNGKLVMWVDNIDQDNGVGEAWVANTDGCTGKKKWTDQMDFWFIHGDDGMIFSDTGAGTASTLKYVNFPNGDSIGAPVMVQAQIARIYALMDFNAVVYSIENSTSANDGLFSYSKLPFASSSDGGAPAPPADAATPPDAAPAPPVDAAAPVDTATTD